MPLAASLSRRDPEFCNTLGNTLSDLGSLHYVIAMKSLIDSWQSVEKQNWHIYQKLLKSDKKFCAQHAYQKIQRIIQKTP